MDVTKSDKMSNESVETRLKLRIIEELEIHLSIKG